MTGPAGGLLAIAGGVAGGTTILACGRGCGTIFRGPCGATGGAAGAVATAGVPGAAGFGAATTGGATTAGRGATGGAAFAAVSACFRSRIAFSASPGFDAFERSNFSFVSAGLGALAVRLPPDRYARTFSASSTSIELEWVFFSVTPTAVSASRMDLLFTSSSRARSLIRTLLIRSFFTSLAPLAAHISLFEVGIVGASIITDFAASAMQRGETAAASHGRFRRQYLRPRPPGLRRPGCLPYRCPAQSALRAHRQR